MWKELGRYLLSTACTKLCIFRSGIYTRIPTGAEKNETEATAREDAEEGEGAALESR